MRSGPRFLSLISFWLVLIVGVGDFANGFLCTRAIGFLIAPIEILLIPAIVSLLIAVVIFGTRLVSDLIAKRPLQFLGLRLQCLTIFIIAIQFLGFDPRLAGLVARAKWSEQNLLEMCKAYRTGGEVAVRDSNVSRWGIGWKPRFRATSEFVEVSWGSTLPRTWGFRVCDRLQPTPTPQYCTNTDDEAAPATERVTAFIGLW
jgi:hypothetical protein